MIWPTAVSGQQGYQSNISLLKAHYLGDRTVNSMDSGDRKITNTVTSFQKATLQEDKVKMWKV